MSLTQERIEKNKEIYLSKFKQYEIDDGSNRLLSYLGDDLFTAPATHRDDLYNAFPGGLIDHTLRLTSYAMKINKILPSKLFINEKSLIKVCFLSHIGRTFLYQFNDSDWHVKNGMPYKYITNITALHTGERSVFYAVSNGIELSSEEYQAIINFDKAPDDSMALFHTETIGDVLKMGNTLAITEEKNKQQ